MSGGERWRVVLVPRWRGEFGGSVLAGRPLTKKDVEGQREGGCPERSHNAGPHVEERSLLDAVPFAFPLGQVVKRELAAADRRAA